MQFHVNSNMTNREAYALHLALPADRMEQLLGLDDTAKAIGDIDDNITEGIAQYPDEGGIDEALDDLRAVAKRLRGCNRVALDAAIEQLELFWQSAVNAGEYGREELRKALAVVEALPT